MDPLSQSITGDRSFPPSGTFEHWQATPLRINLALAGGQNLNTGEQIILEVHSCQNTAGTPLAAITHTIVDFDGPWTFDFTAAQMNQSVTPGSKFRDLWLVIVALFPAGRMETLATRSVKLHRSNYSGTTPAPPAVTQATINDHEARIAALEAGAVSVLAGQYGGTGVANTGKTLTLGGSYTLNGTTGSTLNMGTGGTLGAAAFVGTSTGGAAGDAGKAALYGAGGTFTARGELNITAAGVAGSELNMTNAGGFTAEVNPDTLTDNRTIGLPDADGTLATQEWVTGTVATEAGNSLTLSAAHHRGVIVFTSASAITLTVPASLGDGYKVSLIQAGAGQVTIAAGGGATVQSYSGFLKTAGQYARAEIFATAASTYNASGALVA